MFLASLRVHAVVSGVWILGPLLNLGMATAEEPRQSLYFRGRIGENLAIQMSLEIVGGEAFGRYYYERFGTPLTLAGTLDENGRLLLAETDERGRQTGRFVGDLVGYPRQFHGHWHSASRARKLATRFAQVAETTVLEIRQSDRVRSLLRFPRLLAHSESSNDPLEPFRQRSIDEAMRFVDENLQTLTSLDTDSACSFDQHVTAEICWSSPELISLRIADWSYTGGAHGNVWYSSVNLKLDKSESRELRLQDLFRPEFDAVSIVSNRCVRDLREQQAEWVIDGQVRKFDEDELVFTLSPAGLELIFAPYVTGPYAAGTRSVRIPFQEFGHQLSDGPWQGWSQEFQVRKAKRLAAKEGISAR